MTFQFDTSGVVCICREPEGDAIPYRWSDLTPFAQGYIEGLFNELLAGFSNYEKRFELAGFSDLHPEALALVLRITDEQERGFRAIGIVPDAKMGRDAWQVQQSGAFLSFPPQSAFLSDDGRVCLRPASEAA